MEKQCIEGCENIDILFRGSLAVFRTRCSESIECLFSQLLPIYCENIDILFRGSLAVFRTRCSESIGCLLQKDVEI